MLGSAHDMSLSFLSLSDLGRIRLRPIGGWVWGRLDRVRQAVDEIHDQVCAAEARFTGELGADSAVSEAMRPTAHEPRPVLLADVQTTGRRRGCDTVGLLNALLRLKPVKAAIGPARRAAATAAHDSGVGSTIKRAIGPVRLTASTTRLQPPG
jgi:microcystin degradation protein MlrC